MVQVKIKNSTWDIELPGKDGSVVKTEDSLVNALRALANSNQEKGQDAFERSVRLANVFLEAKTSGFIVLDEADYDYFCKLAKTELPAQWGYNTKLSAAIVEFLSAKQEANKVAKTRD